MVCGECGLNKPLVANRGKNIRRCVDCSKVNAKSVKQAYYKSNLTYIKKRANDFQNARMSEWRDYLQSHYGDPICQLCDKKLIWFGLADDKSITVHLDHRHGGVESIDYQPTKWMRVRHCTLANQVIFNECDFGILCNVCNRMLPTLNRDQWLAKLEEYHGQTETNLNY